MDNGWRQCGVTQCGLFSSSMALPPFYPPFLHMMTGDIPNWSFSKTRLSSWSAKFRVASLNLFSSTSTFLPRLCNAMQCYIVSLSGSYLLPSLPLCLLASPLSTRACSVAGLARQLYLCSTALMQEKLDSLLGPVHKHDVSHCCHRGPCWICS